MESQSKLLRSAARIAIERLKVARDEIDRALKLLETLPSIISIDLASIHTDCAAAASMGAHAALEDVTTPKSGCKCGRCIQAAPTYAEVLAAARRAREDIDANWPEWKRNLGRVMEHVRR